MIALLVPDICGQAITHKSSAAIFMDLASVWFRALNTSGVYITSWKPNKDSPIGCTSCLTSGSSRGGTGTEILRAATRVIRNVFGTIGHISNGKVKVGDTLIVLEYTARLDVARRHIIVVHRASIKRMLTLLDSKIRSDTFTHKSTAAIFMDLARRGIPTLETSSGLRTFWEPNQPAIKLLFAINLGLGGPTFTSAMTLRTARSTGGR